MSHDRSKRELTDALLLELRRTHGPAAVQRIERAFSAEATAEAYRCLNPMQRPTFLFPGLRAQAWHDTTSVPAALTLEAQANVVREELLAVLNRREGFQTYRQPRETFAPKDHWKSLYFMIAGRKVNVNRNLCPSTAAIVDSLSDIHSLAMFSVILGHGHITPHCGPTNTRLTLHLGLMIPAKCGIRVGSEVRTWVEGRCLVFDDSFEHEAWNSSDAPRIVLLVDVWHPDLTRLEIDCLLRLRETRQGEASRQALNRVLEDRSGAEPMDWWPETITINEPDRVRRPSTVTITAIGGARSDDGSKP